MLHQHYKENPTEIPNLNIFQTILTFRNFRVGMVQTKEQYEFCYRAILEEYENITKEKKEENLDPKESKNEEN